MLFLLKCPKCKNNMKYETRSMILFKKRKVCVYCNHHYSVKDAIIKRLK